MPDHKPWYLSKTIIGAVVVLAAGLARSAGLDLAEGDIERVVYAAMETAGAVLAIVGRLTARDTLR